MQFHRHRILSQPQGHRNRLLALLQSRTMLKKRRSRLGVIPVIVKRHRYKSLLFWVCSLFHLRFPIQRTPATPPENMAACSNCGRFFNEDRVQKHESICKKQKKRKVFDAIKHRVQGTEAEVYVKKALKATPKKQAAAPVPTETGKKSNWRKKHEEFIAAIRSAKQVQAHLAAGGKLSDVSVP